MDELKELVWLVNRRKLRSLQRLAQPLDASTKQGRLYKGIANGQITSDTEALSDLYEKEESAEGAYRKLKLTLRDRLISVLFIMDARQPAFSNYQRAYYECCQSWAAIKMLLGRNARKSAIQLARRALKQAVRFEFSDVCRDITDVLRFHYGAIEGDFKKYEEYNQLYQQYQGQAMWEAKAKGLYLSLVIHYVNEKGYKTKIGRQAAGAYEELRAALSEYNTHNLHLYAFLIRLIETTSLKAHEQTIAVCEEAIEFFDQKPFHTLVTQQTFHYQLLECYIQLRKFEKGKRVAGRCLESQEKGSFNWFKYMELYFILSMHTRQYRQAYKIFRQADGNARFDALPDNFRELWRIHEAYLHYLKALGKFEVKGDDKRFSKFRLGKFLNETPIFSQDKKGVNVSILIIQFLFFVLRRQYDKAGDSAISLDQYNKRYLVKGEHYRSHCLIKMLVQVPRARFHLQATLRKADKYYERLTKAPIEWSGQVSEVEIIPYEDIWEMLLESLNNTMKLLKNGGWN